MKARILAIPGGSTSKRSGITLDAINGIGFKEKTTYVFQMHTWKVTDKGFEEAWEDVPIINEKDVQHGEGRLASGGT